MIRFPRMTYRPLAAGPAPALAPNLSPDMADLLRQALTGWMPGSAASGLEALFDRMEAGR